MKIPFQEIETVEVENGWFWADIRVRYTSGEEVVSGLSRHKARAFADALESLRINWWRKVLAEHVGTLNSVQDDLAQLADPPMYMARSIFSTLERKARDVVAQFPSQWPDKLSGVAEIQMLKTIQDFLKDPEAHRTRANDIFVVNELGRSREFFDKIETRPLTDEQRRSVVVNEDRNLVVAAAGSGKTSVIVAKAGWLLHKNYWRPSELLLLAFASDAQKEMQQRIRERLGDEVVEKLTVRTFHSLGMSIIGEVEGKLPTLAKVATDDKALRKLLKDIIADLFDDSKFSKIMSTWFQEHSTPYKSEYEFKTQGEYWDYIRANEIRSLKGDRVKSFEECEIANFLYLNGVPYEYERDYEHDTATSERRQYQPDFYLSDSGIYIEHFALNELGDTPPFIDREEYLQSMLWKQQTHSRYGTVLIETFSHEKGAGKLTENLAAKLADYNVTLSPISSAEVFAALQEQGRIDPFTQLIATFLHHYKEAQLSAEEIARRVAKIEDCPRAEAFITVFKRIFECYQERLAKLQQIDFHDMIGKATEHVENQRYHNPFGYILVDEFQDISPGRARLLKALLDRYVTTQLFAVGDDWQAIYRFAGSDIAIMREFRERFGESKRINMQTTFRCADRIATVATKFVLRNPAQIPKDVSSTLQLKEPCVHVGLGGESPDLLREVMKTIADDTGKNNGTSTVLLLGRYRHLQPENMYQLSNEYPDLHLSYKTVHSSKGLEADYVVVLGLCS
ncbi:MAG: AAA family ATPase, partial [Candidatus Dadabacteria bacterium]|nr:AAA family ATPase [Candidatus Dadabacteria bacterium]